MTGKEIFRQNLRQMFVDKRLLSTYQIVPGSLPANHLEEQTGVPASTLSRWLLDGMTRPDKRSRPNLEKLRQLFGLETVEQFWEQAEHPAVTACKTIFAADLDGEGADKRKKLEDLLLAFAGAIEQAQRK